MLVSTEAVVVVVVVVVVLSDSVTVVGARRVTRVDVPVAVTVVADVGVGIVTTTVKSAVFVILVGMTLSPGVLQTTLTLYLGPKVPRWRLM